MPALVTLRAAFPGGESHLVGNPAAAPLLELAGVIDGWTDFDAPAVGGLFVAGGPGRAAGLGPIGAAVAWCADPDGVLRTNLTRLGAPADRMIVAPSRPPAGVQRHVADHLVDTIMPLVGGAAAPPTVGLEMPTVLAAAAHDRLTPLGLGERRFVAVHPGSGSPRKNWPPESFAALLERLPSLDVAPLLLAGPAEEGVLDRVLARLATRPAVLRDLPLLELAAVLKRAAGYLGNDSGPTHLAALLGVPTLALFGPTDPALWAPRGPRVRVVRHEPLAELCPDTVLVALRDLLA